MELNKSIYFEEGKVYIIDQRWLPHKLVIETLETVDDAVTAIKDMYVRGAPLIGATAAYGMYLAVLNGDDIGESARKLIDARPTAIDLTWAVNKQLDVINNIHSISSDEVEITLNVANSIVKETIENCRLIGEHGSSLIQLLF